MLSKDSVKDYVVKVFQKQISPKVDDALPFPGEILKSLSTSISHSQIWTHPALDLNWTLFVMRFRRIKSCKNYDCEFQKILNSRKIVNLDTPDTPLHTTHPKGADEDNLKHPKLDLNQGFMSPQTLFPIFTVVHHAEQRPAIPNCISVFFVFQYSIFLLSFLQSRGPPYQAVFL